MGKGHDRDAELISRSRSATTPMARQTDIESTARPYAGERPFGRAANVPSTRLRKRTDADMGPHNWAATKRARTDYAIERMRCTDSKNWVEI